MPQQSTILVVDDEKEIADLVERYLQNEGFTVCKCYNGKDALSCVKAENLALAILDVMLPDMDGFTLCQEIRHNANFPIIMLTAKVEQMDKITGLTLGADDYITKPFHPMELLARVKAQIRRYTRYNEPKNESVDHLDFAGLVIDKQTHTATLYDEVLNLTPLEFSILWLLCENRGRVIPTEELFEKVWGERYLDSNNTVMVHIRRLREKMHEPAKNPKFIKTVWGWAIKLKHNRFIALKVKMLCIIILSAGTAVLIAYFFLVYLVDGPLQDPAANFLVSLGLYRFAFQNKELILTIACIILLLIGFYIGLSRFTGYLDEISDGVEQVFLEKEEVLSLSPELKAMEDQLNAIKRTLSQREAAAKESEAKKNDLVVYLAHDLKTPLTSVIGYLNLLHDEKEISPPLQEKYIRIALDKAERLEELINEFFEITRSNLQHSVLAQDNVNLTMLLQQVVEEFYPTCSERQLDLQVDIPSHLILLGDGDKLARVFDNLLRNAVCYTPNGGTIWLNAVEEENNIQICCRNQGKPIPQEQLEQIFEKFYRLDSSRSSKTGGAGLGLAIARQIVELHHGSITAQSSEAYTQFMVTLPKIPLPSGMYHENMTF